MANKKVIPEAIPVAVEVVVIPEAIPATVEVVVIPEAIPATVEAAVIPEEIPAEETPSLKKSDRIKVAARAVLDQMLAESEARSAELEAK